MLQSWVPGFNLDDPSDLTFLMWVTSRNLSYEHHNHALDIAKFLGEVIGIGKSNTLA